MATATAQIRHRTGSSRRVSGPGRYSRLVYGIIGAVGFLLLWEFGSRAGIIDEYFFSRPSLIVAAGAREVQLERFWTDVRVSTTEFVLAYVLAIVIGIPLGLLTGWYKRLNYFLDPWLNFFNSLPRIALIPVIITAYQDRSFTFEMKQPPVSYFLKKAAKIEKGSQTPGKGSNVGRVTRDQIREIAEKKMADLNCDTVESAMAMIEGSARSMGMEVA